MVVARSSQDLPQSSQVKIYSPGYIEQCAAGPSCPVRGRVIGLQAVLQQRELRGMSVRVRAVTQRLSKIMNVEPRMNYTALNEPRM